MSPKDYHMPQDFTELELCGLAINIASFPNV